MQHARAPREVLPAMVLRVPLAAPLRLQPSPSGSEVQKRRRQQVAAKEQCRPRSMANQHGIWRVRSTT